MDSYLLLKCIHIVGVVLFLGNIIVTGWWKFMADRTRNPSIIAFAQRQVTLTDYLFTLGGSTLVLAAGLGNAVWHDIDYLSIQWLARGYWLFVVSGVIWVMVLIPVQIKQAQMARAFADQDKIPDKYWQLCRIWNIFGVLATVIPLSVIYWLVFKPVE